jgi:hypothetical protein
MIYDAIKRRDNLISGLRDSQEFFCNAMNRQHGSLIDWMRWQIEKRETRLDTIGLIAKAGGEPLTADAARTAGEVAAFQAVLAYIHNGWKAE